MTELLDITHQAVQDIPKEDQKLFFQKKGDVMLSRINKFTHIFELSPTRETLNAVFSQTIKVISVIIIPKFKFSIISSLCEVSDLNS